MKRTNLKAITTGFITAIMALPLVLSIVPAGAIGEGQVEGGDIYRPRNVTQGTDFVDPTSAEPCDSLQYKVRIHNPGPGEIEEVNVSVNLPGGASQSNVSTVNITSQNAQPASTSDTATVNLSSAQSINYVSGSTQLLDQDGGVISSLPDGITSGGVNIGKVGISIEKMRFVQFKAEVDCPKPPEKPPEKPEKPEQPPEEQPPEVVTTSPPSAPPAAPVALPDTGPGDVIAAIFSVTVASSVAYFVVVRRLSAI